MLAPDLVQGVLREPLHVEAIEDHLGVRRGLGDGALETGRSSRAPSLDSRTVTRLSRCIAAVASASAGDSSGRAFDAPGSSGSRSSPRRASHFITRA